MTSSAAPESDTTRVCGMLESWTTKLAPPREDIEPSRARHARSACRRWSCHCAIGCRRGPAVRRSTRYWRDNDSRDRRRGGRRNADRDRDRRRRRNPDATAGLHHHNRQGATTWHSLRRLGRHAASGQGTHQAASARKTPMPQPAPTPATSIGTLARPSSSMKPMVPATTRRMAKTR